jgi:hypothetical protein
LRIRRDCKSALPPSRFCGYTSNRAVVVVEAQPFLIATESIAMIIFGIIASFAALGALCWVLFNLAVFALPFFAGVSAGMAAFHSGAGPVGAFAIGILAGAATLVAGQFAVTLLPSPLLRGGVALLFAAPAAFAGYHASHGIAAMTMPSEVWRQSFAVLGSLIVGITALVRVSQPLLPSASSGPHNDQYLPAK